MGWDDVGIAVALGGATVQIYWTTIGVFLIALAVFAGVAFAYLRFTAPSKNAPADDRPGKNHVRPNRVVKRPSAFAHIVRRWRLVHVAIAVLLGLAAWQAIEGRESLRANVAESVCLIKGNINPKTGARIYHVPGGRYYWATRIDFMRGERWFCSEAEAREAGWRKSKK